MKKHSVGFIGAGMISQIAHLPFYLKNKKIEVKAISDDRFTIKNYLIDHLKLSNVFDHHKEIMNDKEIQTVIIIAPRQANSKLIYEALSKGKNVISEKPAAYSLKQLQKRLAVIKNTKQQYHIGYMKRYDLGIQRVKSKLSFFMKSLDIGNLISSRFYNYSKSYSYPIPLHQIPKESRNIRFSTWDPAPDWLPKRYLKQFDWFQNVASHDINLMNYVFDNNLYFDRAKMINNNYIKSNFFYKGTPVTLELIDAEAGNWLQGGEFIFEKGRLSFDIPSPMNKSRLTNFEVDIKGSKEKLIYHTKGDWPFKVQANDFMNSLIYGGDSLCMGKNCLKDLILIEKVWKDII